MSDASKLILLLAQMLTIISAVIVAIHPNILYAAVALFFTLFGVAILFLFLGSDFIAGVQIIVYAGGVTILVLFAIMLTRWLYRVRLRDISAKYIVPSFIAVCVFVLVYRMLVEMGIGFERQVPSNVGQFVASPKTAMIGKALLGNHMLAFESVTILLLGALVGAVWLARPKESTRLLIGRLDCRGFVGQCSVVGALHLVHTFQEKCYWTVVGC